MSAIQGLIDNGMRWGNITQAEQAAAELAAKDARIAELEQSANVQRMAEIAADNVKLKARVMELENLLGLARQYVIADGGDDFAEIIAAALRGK